MTADLIWWYEILYDILKNKWKDGRHFADPELMRTGFITMYEAIRDSFPEDHSCSCHLHWEIKKLNRPEGQADTVTP
jgi:hypothetical protein